jgi:hypothetical protein
MWVELLAALSTEIYLADFRDHSCSNFKPKQLAVKMGLAQQKKYDTTPLTSYKHQQCDKY